MDWLLHNAIADMYGPHFLLFYAGVILVTLGACWWSAQSADTSGALPPATVPAQPDPYEMAFLRGGAAEAAQLAVFSLIERGYLTRGNAGRKAWIERSKQHPDPTLLNPIERAVFNWFAGTRGLRQVFQRDLAARLESLCWPFQQRLEGERLLMPQEAMARTRQVRWTATAVILGVGGYKLIVALAKGYSNVGFLILMGIGALIGLALVCRPSRLTRRGKQYLQRLQLAFQRLKPQVATSAPAAAGADSNALLLMGLFGAGALMGTSFAYYPQMVRAASPSSSGGGSCGGGSSCSGGSSCGGGGCGGCGSG